MTRRLPEPRPELPQGEGRADEVDVAGILERIRLFLAEHSTLTLATIAPGGAPSAAAVFYAADAELNLYFLSEAGTEHVENMHARPLVAATIQADGQAWRQIRGLQLRGTAERVPAQELAHAVATFGRAQDFLAGALAGGPGPLVLAGPLARAGFWVIRPVWLRLVDNTVRFGFKETLRREHGQAWQGESDDR